MARTPTPTAPAHSHVDLWCRRTALGITQSTLADYVGTAQANLAAAERGKRAVPRTIWPHIEALEAAAASITEHAISAAAHAHPDPDDVVWLNLPTTVDMLTARDRRRHANVPIELYRIAIGRAAATLAAAGRTVRIREAN